MTGIDSWSTTAATNATTDAGSINWAEGMPPSGVNNSARQALADVRTAFNDLMWFPYGTGDQGPGNIAVPAVYSSGTAFTIVGGNVTLTYHAGRRVRAVGSATGTIYGSISSSSYNGGNSTTTVNVTWDSGSLSNETLTVSLSQIPGNRTALSTAAISDIVTGTWTPALSAGTSSFSYGSRNGRYTRQGDLLYLDFAIAFTPTVTGSGPLLLSSLPYSANASNVSSAAGTLGVSGLQSWSGSLVLGLNSVSQIRFLAYSSSGQTVLGTTNLNSGSSHTMNGSIWLKL